MGNIKKTVKFIIIMSSSFIVFSILFYLFGVDGIDENQYQQYEQLQLKLQELKNENESLVSSETYEQEREEKLEDLNNALQKDKAEIESLKEDIAEKKEQLGGSN